MNNSVSYTDYIKLHAIVIIFGFTGILGKLISLPAINLVWYRMVIAIVFFGIILIGQNTSLRINFAELIKISGVGIIVALHWITFFGAIKLSNVSVALGCLASTTLFTSFIEPFFFKARVSKIEVFFGIVIIAGLYLIFKFEFHYWKGILTAISSAVLCAFFMVFNRKLVIKTKARLITFYEMLGGLLAITFFLAVSDLSSFLKIPGKSDTLYLLLLGIVCTAFTFVVQIDIMKKLSAFMVLLAVNLEPIYGILLAGFLFKENEQMTSGFYLGTLLIILSVFVYPVLKRKISHHKINKIKA